MEPPFPSYDGENPFVFVCYAHADQDVVYEEIEWLSHQGVNIWYDEGISAGKNWRAEIGTSIDGASWVLFYISRASLESDHCNREINLALDEGKEIIPIYLEDVPLTPDLKIGLNRVQAIHRDRQSSESYRSSILAALNPNSSVTGMTSDQDSKIPGKPRFRHRKHLLIATGLAIVLMLFATVLSPPIEEPVTESTDTADEKPYVLVVPFDVSAANDKAWDPFADQMTREIIRKLRRVSGIKTVPAPSAFAFNANKTRPHIQSELPEVRYVLDGLISVESNSNIRVSLSLEDLKDGKILWDDDHFVRDDHVDLFAVQSEVARSVSAALQVAVHEGEEQALNELPTSDLAAYALYNEGIEFQNISTNETLIHSIENFDAALELDPDFSLAYVAKAISYRQRMTFFEPPIDMLSYVHAAATNAIALDPASAYARSALGMAYLQSWHFDDAWRYLSDARSRDPRIGITHTGLALYYTSLGDKQRAFESLAAADDQDPLNPEIAGWAIFIHFLFGETASGMKLADEKVRLFPQVPLVSNNAGWIYSLANEHERAISLGEKALELGQRGPFFLIGLAQIYARAGRTDEAQAILHEVEQSESYICPYEKATVSIMLDKKEEAFEQLDRAVEYRSNCLMFTRQDPRLEAIRDDPRYSELLDTVGLDDLSIGGYSR